MIEGEEKAYYERFLNKKENEWYAPYAIRRETNDVVSKHDKPNYYSDALFTKISEKDLYKK